MYPFMGGTANSHKICGIEPTTASHILTYGGNLSNAACHTSAGINTLTFQGFADMGVNINVIHSSVNDIVIGGYVSTATTGNECFVIGKTSNAVSATTRYQFNIPFDGNNVYVAMGSANFTAYDNGIAPVGRWIGSRTSSTSIVTYKNGTSVATNTVTNTGNLATEAPRFFSALDGIGVSKNFNGVCGFIFGGDGLSGAQVTTFDGILSTFLTAIGR